MGPCLLLLGLLFTTQSIAVNRSIKGEDDSVRRVARPAEEGERCCLRQTGDTPLAKSKRKPHNMAFMIGQKSGQLWPAFGCIHKMLTQRNPGVTTLKFRVA